MMDALRSARQWLRRARGLVTAFGTGLLVMLAASEQLARRAGDAASTGGTGAGRLASAGGRWAIAPGRFAAERWRERAGARRARIAARGRYPLPNLWEVHPGARRALGRDVGLRSVPLDRIVGTAVAGVAQRGGDFLPLPAFRSRNWEGRWKRVNRALDSLAILPPVDLVKYGDDYWVEDGHNRVAAALYGGQVDIDAIVRELRAPGYVDDDTQTVATLAPLAAVGSELRAAGAGRFSSEAADHSSALDLDTASTGGPGEHHDHGPTAGESAPEAQPTRAAGEPQRTATAGESAPTTDQTPTAEESAPAAE